MPFYLQQLRGYTPSQAGMIMTAVPLTMMVVAPFSGWLSDRIGSIVLSSTGLTVSAAAFLWLSGLDANSAAREVMLRLILLGIGSGLFQSPNNSAAMGAVPRHRLGIASGLLVMMRNMGMVTGMAVASAVFSGRMAMYSAHLAGHPGPAAFLAALGDTYRVAAGISAVGVVTSLVRGQQARNS
jgi:MFS family permease